MNALLLLLAAAGLAGAGVAARVGAETARDAALLTSVVPVLAALLVSILRDLRRGETGVDVLAALSMIGALVLGERLAGAVIALMYAGGRSLEDYARERARRALGALLARVPRVAHRYAGEALLDTDVDAVRPGDRLLVRTGEVVPVDGLVAGEPAVLDESALTGESRPVRREPGERVPSGALNAGGSFDLDAVARSADSTFAAVVRLVERAQASKAPSARLADRYALLFVPASLLVAGLAWLGSGDPVRALAVLVVATPCPLILAVPVAIVAGVSRAARRGILVKDAGALEALARAEIVLLDKTGTVTTGAVRVARIEAGGDFPASEVLRYAASLEQASSHVVAASVVAAARERGLPLDLPRQVEEVPGAGLEGVVAGRRIALGGHAYVSSRAQASPWVREAWQTLAWEGASGIFVAVDGEVAGVLVTTDTIRADAPRALRALRRAGVERVVMVSGDRHDIAESIAAALGIDSVLAERSPEDKVDAVRAERTTGMVAMVGDGVNDAPALAAADVGVAMGARGAGASSEAADVVLTVDRLDRLAEALAIARRSRAIAAESVVAGMVLSFAAMGAAAFGLLPPVAGAVLQELIDVAVIGNALRALARPRGERQARTLPSETVERLKREHAELAPIVERLFATADRLDRLAACAARAELLELDRLLREHLVPHETSDDRELYPMLAPLMGGDDPLGSMSRTHREIVHLSRVYGRLVAELSEDGPAPAERRELQRVLYGLGAILRLHLAQEEELYEVMREVP